MRFHDVAKACDAVVIVGSDYTDVASPSELSFNARIAVNLGAPVLLVVRGVGSHARRGRATGRTVYQPSSPPSTLTWSRSWPTAATPTSWTRSPPRWRFGVPSWTLPEVPLLMAPTMAEL